MIKLIKPNKKYYQLYKDMMDKWNMEGSRIDPWALHLKYHTRQYFDEMLKRVQEVERCVNLEGYAASTTYWVYDTDKVLLRREEINYEERRF